MTGGNLLYGNLMKQVEYKVNEFAPPNAKVKTVATCTPAERKYTEWIGGSIVTSLSSFQSYWIGEQEWK
jgi:actin-related protein